VQSMYYGWSKEFLDAAGRNLTAATAADRCSDSTIDLGQPAEGTCGCAAVEKIANDASVRC
jgi:hypothetical protein